MSVCIFVCECVYVCKYVCVCLCVWWSQLASLHSNIATEFLQPYCTRLLVLQCLLNEATVPPTPTASTSSTSIPVSAAEPPCAAGLSAAGSAGAVLASGVPHALTRTITNTHAHESQTLTHTIQTHTHTQRCLSPADPRAFNMMVADPPSPADVSNLIRAVKSADAAVASSLETLFGELNKRSLRAGTFLALLEVMVTRVALRPVLLGEWVVKKARHWRYQQSLCC